MGNKNLLLRNTGSCRLADQITDPNICKKAILRLNKEYNSLSKAAVRSAVVNTELTLVKYYTDSRIFSFILHTDDEKYDEIAIRYFANDTINLRESEFTWVDPDHSPVTYFETN